MDIKNFRMKEGEELYRNPNRPIIGITGKGKGAYLWVGNDAEDDKFCFATLSGAKTLEKLANAILSALGNEKNNHRKK